MRIDPNELPPHSDDLELALLGAVFLDHRTYFATRPMVRDTTFWRESHRKIWRVLAEVCEAEAVPDSLTVIDRLQTAGDLEVCGGPNYIARLTNYTPSAANAVTYAKRLLELEQLRELQRTLEVTRSQTDTEADPLELAGGLRSDLNRILSRAGHAHWHNAGETADEWLEHYNEKKSGDRTTYTRTNLVWLDSLLGGGVKGGYSYFVGGTYKAGKSKFTQAIARAMLEQGWHVDWWSGEMDRLELATRFISSIGGIDERELDDPEEGAILPGFDEAMRRAWATYRGFEDRWRTRVHGEIPLHDIIADTTARAMILQGSSPEPPKYMLVVDYLQQVDAGIPKVHIDDVNNLNAVSRSLNALSKDLKIPVVVVYQLNARKVAERQKDQDFVPAPRHTDTYGTQQIQKDANELLLVHRPWFEKSGGNLEEFMTCDRVLARAGKRRMKYLRAQLGYNQFQEWNDEIPYPFGR